MLKLRSTLAQFLMLLYSATVCNAQLHYFQPSSAAIYHPRRLQPAVAASLAHYQYESNALTAAAPPPSVAHPAVIANSLSESALPSDLLKSERFYKNPHIAAALAKESWFTSQEMPVLDREAEKIPREEIYKLFHNAGWIKRR